MSFPESGLKFPQIGVSNTEVQQGYSCEQAWLFGFHPEMNYQAKDMGIARTRGIIGHKALEIFYEALKEEVPYNEAAQLALNHVHNLRVKESLAGDYVNPTMLDLLNYLYKILERYFKYYEDEIEDWEILEVESFYAMEWHGETDFYLPSRMDLVIYHRGGPFKGEVSPVDHKFNYDFWHRPKFVLNSQFPIYIRALRAARFKNHLPPVVKRVIVNEIRTRFSDTQVNEKSGWDLFKRTTFSYSAEKIERVFQNHMKSAVRLAWLKRQPLDEAMDEIKVSLGSMACQYCDFKDLCDATFEGDVSAVESAIEATMKPNEYGYPPLEEIIRERD